MLDDKELKLSEEQLKIMCFALSSYIDSLQKTLDSLRVIDDPNMRLIQLDLIPFLGVNIFTRLTYRSLY